MLSSHPGFPQVLAALGYEPVSVTVFLEFNLAEAEPRDPRAVLIRRQTQLDLQEDAVPANWWENQALSELHMARFRLLARSDGAELARATTWDMSWFGRGDGQTRIGLIGVEVSLQHRRKGYGRYLVSEVIRWAREHAVALVEVQTSSSNRPRSRSTTRSVSRRSSSPRSTGYPPICSIDRARPEPGWGNHGRGAFLSARSASCST